MKTLLLTTKNDTGVKSGAFVYSEMVIEALRKTQLDLEVVHLARRKFSLVKRVLGLFIPQPFISSLLVPVNIDTSCYDLVVFDHIRTVNCVSFKLCRTLLISHNLEYANLESVLKSSNSLSLMERFALRIDLVKLKRWERNIYASMDFVFSINQIENNVIKRYSYSNVLFPYINVPNSKPTWSKIFSGRIVVGLIGSFKYSLKRQNLIDLVSFFNRSKPIAKLIVAGEGSGDAGLVSSNGNVEVLGGFTDISEVYSLIDLLLIHEPFGGGFKLKIKSAVENSMPFFAHRDAVKGTPFADNKKWLYTSFNELLNKLDTIDKAGLQSICNDQKLLAESIGHDYFESLVDTVVSEHFLGQC